METVKVTCTVHSHLPTPTPNPIVAAADLVEYRLCTKYIYKSRKIGLIKLSIIPGPHPAGEERAGS